MCLLFPKLCWHIRLRPTPNPDCPGQPCQTLDYYFSHKEEYFNSKKINVTMLLLGGEHILSSNHTEYVDTENCYTGYTHLIKDLEMFEMIGLESAHDVIVQVFIKHILLVNIVKLHFASLNWFIAVTNKSWFSINLFECVLSANTGQSSEKTVSVDNVTFVMVIIVLSSMV